MLTKNNIDQILEKVTESTFAIPAETPLLKGSKLYWTN